MRALLRLLKAILDLLYPPDPPDPSKPISTPHRKARFLFTYF